jgi:AbrB family looped-hinge helix DNA binding protein
MPTATLTSKGQLTLPKAVRERLKVRAGDSIDFIVGEDGDIRVRAGTHDVKELRGLLHRPGRRAVSLTAMDAAIRAGRATRP